MLLLLTLFGNAHICKVLLTPSERGSTALTACKGKNAL
jgi:hypothetical protein